MLYSAAVMPVAPTSICPVASAVAIGAAAWKNTSCGSMPNSLKKPLSTPMKSGAEEVSLRAPIFTGETAWADESTNPVARRPTAGAGRSRWARLMTWPPRYGQPLAAREEPVREDAEEGETDDAHHELGRVHDVARVKHKEADARVGRDHLCGDEEEQR